MLPLLLMLIADPLTPPPPPAAPGVRIDAEGTMRSVDQAVEAAQARCRNVQRQQAGGSGAVQPGARLAAGDLMFRQGDPVSRTLLLERQIGQCSVPISYDVAPDGRLPSLPARAD